MQEVLSARACNQEYINVLLVQLSDLVYELVKIMLVMHSILFGC